MKTKHWRTGAALVLTVWLQAADADAAEGDTTAGGGLPARTEASRGLPTSRTDVNPALLYGHGFQAFPVLSDEQRKGFFSDPPTLSPSEGASVAGRYEEMLRHVRRAAQMKAPCDWGSDPADGPAAFVPSLVNIRRCLQAGLARAHYLLEEGRELEVAEELAALVVLGRNVSRDGTLVQTMIGLACEGAVVDFFERNFARFSSDAREEFLRRLTSARGRGTVKGAMELEQAQFFDWLVARLDRLEATHPDDAERVVKGFVVLLQGVMEQTRSHADGLSQLSGKTVKGLRDDLDQLRPVYAKTREVAQAAPDEIERLADELRQLSERSSNWLASVIVPNVGKARQNELRLAARLAMLRAAIALQAEGEEAFRQIVDPFGSGPFARRTISDREIELESKLIQSGRPVSLRVRK